jgi:F-type H+-transporting ATPase subunit delta
MKDLQIATYAAAMLAIARAEGEIKEVEAELATMRNSLTTNELLSTTLTDSTLPVELRQGIVEDLLGPIATPITTALVSFVIAAGHGRDLAAIIDRFVAMASGDRGEVIAEVRSAVALTAAQNTELTASLTKKLGKPVAINNVVDDSVLGGLLIQVGDTVIDSSVRNRFEQLKESL